MRDTCTLLASGQDSADIDAQLARSRDRRPARSQTTTDFVLAVREAIARDDLTEWIRRLSVDTTYRRERRGSLGIVFHSGKAPAAEDCCPGERREARAETKAGLDRPAASHPVFATREAAPRGRFMCDAPGVSRRTVRAARPGFPGSGSRWYGRRRLGWVGCRMRPRCRRWSG